MSIQNVDYGVNLRDVIVKDIEGEPIRLKALKSIGNVVSVTSIDMTATIGFPSVHVFFFDESLFNQMHSAFMNHDTETLARLWKRAKRFDSESC